LKLGWTEEPDNLNVFIGYNATCWEIWALNYDYVFGLGDSNQPTLDLATVFPTQQNGGISANGRIWTIHIRSGVRFDDGTPLTAADVAFSYEYVLRNDIGQYMNYLQGVQSVRELNPTTVQFTCSHAMAVGYMEVQSVPILPKHIWEHVSPEAAITSYGDKAPIIGSGPFEVVGYVKGSYIEMVRNPYYWGPKPTIDTIYFEAYQNADTMVTDLTKGVIDGAWGVPVAQFKQLQAAKGFKAIAYPFGWDYLEFNCYTKASSEGSPILRDPRFRGALNYAVNKQTLCNLAYEGLAQPATTIILPTMAYHWHWQPPADQLYTFDLAKARQLLTAAGYPLRNGVRLDKQGKPIVLRLMVATDGPPEQIEAKLIVGWLEQLGLTIRLSIIDSGTLTSTIYNGHGSTWKPNYDLVVSGWTGYYDPGQTLDCLTTPEIGNLDEPYWSNAQYDRLAVEQATTVDPQQRRQLIWQMQQIMYQQTPWIPLVYYEDLEAVNTAKWTGWAQQIGGPAWNCEGYIATYLDLRPVAATSAKGGGIGGTTIAVIVVVAIAVIGAVVLIRRRARKAEVEV
jgi:peptide/nickel transport system substrate-binding protein